MKPIIEKLVADIFKAFYSHDYSLYTEDKVLVRQEELLKKLMVSKLEHVIKIGDAFSKSQKALDRDDLQNSCHHEERLEGFLNELGFFTQ